MIYQNHDVTDDDIMKSLHVSKEGLRKVKLASNKCISIDQRLSDTNSDWNDDKKTTLQDILVDHKNKSSHEMAIKDEEKKIIRSAIDTLEEKDKKIIVQLFFGNKTLGQVGKGLNISAEAVRQRKRNALRQLRFRIAKKIKMTRRGIYA
jgi:RNA polymerase sigma factor (sigma-70 family)